MSTIHEVECDFCGKHEPLKYNGEHWLTPEGWKTLWDDNLAQVTNEHICPGCWVKQKNKPKINDRRNK